MGAWYTIGLFAGLGTAIAVMANGLLAALPRGAQVAFAIALVVSVALGLTIETWKEAVAAAIGAVLGWFGSYGIVGGALRRGGTAVGVALLVVAAGVVLAGLAFVPVLGYLEALALPLLGRRMRARDAGRYEGLRILARD